MTLRERQWYFRWRWAERGFDEQEIDCLAGLVLGPTEDRLLDLGYRLGVTASEEERKRWA